MRLDDVTLIQWHRAAAGQRTGTWRGRASCRCSELDAPQRAEPVQLHLPAPGGTSARTQNNIIDPQLTY